MSYEKLAPIEGGHGGCLCCGYQHDILPLDALIGVGFGYAAVTKNGEEVWREDTNKMGSWDDYWTCATAEKEASKVPDNDWRIHLVAPLSERHYQRQGDSHWVLYEKGQGFA